MKIVFLDELVIQNNKVILQPYEVDQAIIDFFGRDKDYKVSVAKDFTMVDGNLNIDFYVIEHLYNDKMGTGIKTKVTDDDLKAVFEDYVSAYKYKVNDIEYIKNSDKKDDFSSYEGIELNVTKKEYVRKRTG